MRPLNQAAGVRGPSLPEMQSMAAPSNLCPLAVPQLLLFPSFPLKVLQSMLGSSCLLVIPFARALLKAPSHDLSLDSQLPPWGALAVSTAGGERLRTRVAAPFFGLLLLKA